MSRKNSSKYKIVYSHLWRTYGASWQVRLSYVLQLALNLVKLIAVPVVASLIISNLSVSDFDTARKNALIFIGFSLFIGIISPLIKYIGMLGENKIYAKSTEDYLSKLISSDIEYFNSNLSGYLTSATRQYVDSVIQLCRNIRDQYMGTVLSVILPLIVILYFDLWLGVVALVLSSIQIIYMFWASNKLDAYRTKSREIYKKNSGNIADAISNILAIKSSAQESTLLRRMVDNAREESKIFAKRHVVNSKLSAVRQLLTVSFYAIIIWLMIYRMSEGSITIAVAVLIVTYTTTILNGVFALSNEIDIHDDYVDKILPALEILNRQNRVNDVSQPVEFVNIRGDIKFDRVSFSYDSKNAQVFQDFSLSIPHGQKLGVVGVSGAGKSTLTKLLLRFNDVSSGAIYIDSINIKNIKQIDLRKNIAYVPQEPLLMHTSIKDNVLLASPDSSEKDTKKALKSAHALSFVEQLPDKLDSIVGERGVKLSGGQKQRIAIARAVLQNAPIIVLDEATSALDSESEQIIKDSFSDILKGKTAIVVAHRLSTLSEMDRIVVIENGKLVEDGTHAQLLSNNNVYARLWQRQQKHIETP